MVVKHTLLAMREDDSGASELFPRLLQIIEKPGESRKLFLELVCFGWYGVNTNFCAGLDEIVSSYTAHGANTWPLQTCRFPTFQDAGPLCAGSLRWWLSLINPLAIAWCPSCWLYVLRLLKRPHRLSLEGFSGRWIALLFPVWHVWRILPHSSVSRSRNNTPTRCTIH